MNNNKLNFDPNKLSQDGLDKLNQGLHDEAKEIFLKLYSFFPNNCDLINLLAFTFLQTKQYHDAIKFYSESLEKNNTQIEIYFNRGIAFEKLGDYEKAIDDYDSILERDKSLPDVFINKASALEKLKDYEKALTSANEGLSLFPRNLMLLAVRGNINYSLLNFNDALSDFSNVLEIDPENIDIIFSKAKVFHGQRNYEEAEKNFNEAIKRSDDNHWLKYNLSLILLYQKRFELGWNFYQNRWMGKDTRLIKPKNIEKVPPFEKSLKKGNLLVWGEQGIGDQVIYGSLLNELPKELNVTVMVDQRLVKIYQRSFPDLTIIKYDKYFNLKPFDFQLPFADLALNYRNSLNSFRSHPQIFLKADKTKTDFFLKDKNKLRIGLSWLSKNDANGDFKSIDLNFFGPHLKNKNYEFINLQYGDVSNEIYDFEKKFNIKIKQHLNYDLYHDIDMLLSLIDSCDIIITCSNVTAHLSGALGKKTFLLIPYSLGLIWYWHDDNQSIWYPSIKLFRQTELGNWSKPIKDILKNIE
jgi:tetratricopeptide (TPR) repeat protein